MGRWSHFGTRQCAGTAPVDVERSVRLACSRRRVLPAHPVGLTDKKLIAQGDGRLGGGTGMQHWLFMFRPDTYAKVREKETVGVRHSARRRFGDILSDPAHLSQVCLTHLSR